MIRKNCVRSDVGGDTIAVKIRNKRFCTLPPLHWPTALRRKQLSHAVSPTHSAISTQVPKLALSHTRYTALHSLNPILSALPFCALFSTSPRPAVVGRRYISTRRQRVLKLAYSRDSYDLIECNQNPLYTHWPPHICICEKTYTHIYIYCVCTLYTLVSMYIIS